MTGCQSTSPGRARIVMTAMLPVRSFAGLNWVAYGRLRGSQAGIFQFEHDGANLSDSLGANSGQSVHDARYGRGLRHPQLCNFDN